MSVPKMNRNYRGFFVLGIALIAVGVATGNMGFPGAGVVFFVIGFVTREKWEEDRPSESHTEE
jgi:hypothetical protein